MAKSKRGRTAYRDEIRIKCEWEYIKGANLEAISKMFGGKPSIGTLHNWSVKYNWPQKRKDFEKKIEQRCREEFKSIKETPDEDLRREIEQIVQSKIQALKELDFLRRICLQRIKPKIVNGKIVEYGDIKPASWSDVIETLKYCAREQKILLGEASEIAELRLKSEGRQQDISQEEIDRMLKDAYERRFKNSK